MLHPVETESEYVVPSKRKKRETSSFSVEKSSSAGLSVPSLSVPSLFSSDMSSMPASSSSTASRSEENKVLQEQLLRASVFQNTQCILSSDTFKLLSLELQKELQEQAVQLMQAQVAFNRTYLNLNKSK